MFTSLAKYWLEFWQYRHYIGINIIHYYWRPFTFLYIAGMGCLANRNCSTRPSTPCTHWPGNSIMVVYFLVHRICGRQPLLWVPVWQGEPSCGHVCMHVRCWRVQRLPTTWQNLYRYGYYSSDIRYILRWHWHRLLFFFL